MTQVWQLTLSKNTLLALTLLESLKLCFRHCVSPPLVDIRQDEQVQAGEQEQGKYGHCR